MSKLVTVLVVSYQSEKYIIETLNSVFSQSYSQIELIISDDCSVDNSYQIASEWLKINSTRFIHSQLIKSEKNLGTSANINRGLSLVSGDYIKIIAADDILYNSSIYEYVLFLEANKSIDVCLSYMNVFTNSFLHENYIKTIPDSSLNKFFYETPLNQYKTLLAGDVINITPTAFYKSSVFERFGNFDERFSLIEDYPMWLNLTKKGCKLSFMPFITVGYRIHSSNVHASSFHHLINPAFFKRENLRKVLVYPYISTLDKCSYQYQYHVGKILVYLFGNQRNAITVVFFILFFKATNVFRIFSLLYQKISSKK